MKNISVPDLTRLYGSIWILNRNHASSNYKNDKYEICSSQDGYWMVLRMDTGWVSTWILDGSQDGHWMVLRMETGWF